MTHNEESEFDLTEEQEREIVKSMKEFDACEHDWVPQSEDAIFFDICSKCGGARGIRMPEGWLEDD